VVIFVNGNCRVYSGSVFLPHGCDDPCISAIRLAVRGVRRERGVRRNARVGGARCQRELTFKIFECGPDYALLPFGMESAAAILFIVLWCFALGAVLWLAKRRL
jgi:hypothetical protein